MDVAKQAQWVCVVGFFSPKSENSGGARYKWIKLVSGFKKKKVTQFANMRLDIKPTHLRYWRYDRNLDSVLRYETINFYFSFASGLAQCLHWDENWIIQLLCGKKKNLVARLQAKRL